MIKKTELIRKINDALALLSLSVKINSSLNLTDINVVAEDFYAEFLNLALGYNLRNINEYDPNAVSIDLGDTVNKIAIQVTSTSNLKKTKKTVEKFIENELYNKYDNLIILNLVKITKHRDTYVGEEGKYQLNTKTDMWDYITLSRKLLHKNIEKLTEIYEFLKKELDLKPEKSIPKEITTMISLIDYLSDDELESVGAGYIEEPDPNGKIYERFFDYSTYLEEQYIELYEMYGKSLEIVHDMTDIGIVKIKKISLYLKSHSDKVLIECEGNPKKALSKLIDEFSEALSSKNIEYDESAISFFLVDELIKCNIFPNKE